MSDSHSWMYEMSQLSFNKDATLASAEDLYQGVVDDGDHNLLEALIHVQIFRLETVLKRFGNSFDNFGLGIIVYLSNAGLKVMGTLGSHYDTEVSQHGGDLVTGVTWRLSYDGFDFIAIVSSSTSLVPADGLSWALWTPVPASILSWNATTVSTLVSADSCGIPVLQDGDRVIFVCLTRSSHLMQLPGRTSWHLSDVDSVVPDHNW